MAPPVAMPTPREGAPEPSVSLRVVGALVEAVERAGGARDAFLRAAQLDAAQLDAADARIPRSRAFALSALALEHTGDPALGLHWAERVDEGSFVPVSHVLAHSANLREALEALARFHRLISDQPSFQLLERHDQAILKVPLNSAPLPVRRFSAEMAVAGYFHLLRHVGAQPTSLLVCFGYPAPEYHREYARVFGVAPRFGQPFTGVVFSRALLDRPALRRDDEVHEALTALAERRLQRLTRTTPYHARVLEFLVRERGGQRTSMDAAARALHLSVRSLRRRLADEGKQYGEIAQAALAVVAQRLLRDEQHTIQETAYELGFTSFSAFHRAFRRATGTTPSAFRAALAHNATH